MGLFLRFSSGVLHYATNPTRPTTAFAMTNTTQIGQVDREYVFKQTIRKVLKEMTRGYLQGTEAPSSISLKCRL